MTVKQTTTYSRPDLDPPDITTNHGRAMHGWQCPECYGVRVIPQGQRQPHDPYRYVCDECGCQWTGVR
jgi:predicted RNA-binding Zn-ribbon protein involved in translation (DUF1610 family)